MTAPTTDWGAAIYGDPCRQCGFGWMIGRPDAVAVVAATPARYAALLGGRTGAERHPDLAWPVVAYVCHVGDNLRIWAERLAGLALGATEPVSPYDEGALARVRAYDDIALPGALWSLGRAVADWQEAVGLVADRGVLLVHPERGEQDLPAVVRSNAHDAYHHGWDIERSVAAAERP